MCDIFLLLGRVHAHVRYLACGFVFLWSRSSLFVFTRMIYCDRVCVLRGLNGCVSSGGCGVSLFQSVSQTVTNVTAQ